MKAKVIFSTKQGPGNGDCAGGTCPTIWETENGTYLVQGQIVANPKTVFEDIPEGETMVELPKEFLEAFKKN